MSIQTITVTPDDLLLQLARIHFRHYSQNELVGMISRDLEDRGHENIRIQVCGTSAAEDSASLKKIVDTMSFVPSDI
jgi:hypothetical protein